MALLDNPNRYGLLDAQGVNPGILPGVNVGMPARAQKRRPSFLSSISPDQFLALGAGLLSAGGRGATFGEGFGAGVQNLLGQRAQESEFGRRNRALDIQELGLLGRGAQADASQAVNSAYQQLIDDKAKGKIDDKTFQLESFKLLSQLDPKKALSSVLAPSNNGVQFSVSPDGGFAGSIGGSGGGSSIPGFLGGSTSRPSATPGGTQITDPRGSARSGMVTVDPKTGEAFLFNATPGRSADIKQISAIEQIIPEILELKETVGPFQNFAGAIGASIGGVSNRLGLPSLTGGLVPRSEAAGVKERGKKQIKVLAERLLTGMKLNVTDKSIELTQDILKPGEAEDETAYSSRIDTFARHLNDLANFARERNIKGTPLSSKDFEKDFMSLLKQHGAHGQTTSNEAQQSPSSTQKIRKFNPATGRLE